MGVGEGRVGNCAVDLALSAIRRDRDRLGCDRKGVAGRKRQAVVSASAQGAERVCVVINVRTSSAA